MRLLKTDFDCGGAMSTVPAQDTPINCYVTTNFWQEKCTDGDVAEASSETVEYSDCCKIIRPHGVTFVPKRLIWIDRVSFVTREFDVKRLNVDDVT